MTRKQQKGGNPDILIRQIIKIWQKRKLGHVSWSPPDKPNNWYLNCTEEDDFKNHIHIILDSQRYSYKRNGKQDNANKKGYGFERDAKWCIEDGANPEEWSAEQWAEFLHSRMCYTEYFGSCQ